MNDPTYLYFIQSGYGCIKIGISADVDKRMATMQTGNEKRLHVVAKVLFPSRTEAYALEQELHQSLKKYRTRGEWFNRRVMRARGMSKVFCGTLKNPELRHQTKTG